MPTLVLYRYSSTFSTILYFNRVYVFLPLSLALDCVQSIWYLNLILLLWSFIGWIQFYVAVCLCVCANAFNSFPRICSPVHFVYRHWTPTGYWMQFFTSHSRTKMEIICEFVISSSHSQHRRKSDLEYVYLYFKHVPISFHIPIHLCMDHVCVDINTWSTLFLCDSK